MVKENRVPSLNSPTGITLKHVIVFLFLMILSEMTFANANSSERSPAPDYRFSISTTWHSFLNFEPEDTNLQMYEFHFGYKLTDKDKIELKFATWKLYEPLGIQMWDSHLFSKSEYYPGRLQEFGVGVCYQRTLWKGLFAAVEIMPMKQNYLNGEGEKIMDGFRLYTSYHIGYHIPLFNDRVYIDPQIHCNYWPVMTDGPSQFKERESREWSKNYLLFEPNIYIGVKL